MDGAKKEWLIQVTVNNCGLDFDDDVSSVYLETDAEVPRDDIIKALTSADNCLREEDEDGECEYNDLGWNCSTLMDKVCSQTGWSWYATNPSITFTIE